MRGRWRLQSVRRGSKWLKISGVLVAEKLSLEFNKLRPRFPSWLILCSELFFFSFFISPLEPRHLAAIQMSTLTSNRSGRNSRKVTWVGRSPEKKKSNYLSRSITVCPTCSMSTWEESAGSARKRASRHANWMLWLNDPSLRYAKEIILGPKLSLPCDVVWWIAKIKGGIDLSPTWANLLLLRLQTMREEKITVVPIG